MTKSGYAIFSGALYNVNGLFFLSRNTFLETVRLHAGIVDVKQEGRAARITLVETPVLEMDDVVCCDSLSLFAGVTGDLPEVPFVSSQPETGDPR